MIDEDLRERDGDEKKNRDVKSVSYRFKTMLKTKKEPRRAHNTRHDDDTRLPARRPARRRRPARPLAHHGRLATRTRET